MLEIRELGVGYRVGAGTRWAFDRLNLAIPSGAALGVIGESGSGKTTLAQAIAGLLPAHALINGGSVRVQGFDLLRLAPAARRAAHRLRVALVPADPRTALDPLATVGAQMREAMAIVGPTAGWRDRALGTLGALGVAEAPRVLAARGFSLAPVLAQAVGLATAMLQGVAALVLDEPIVEPSDRDAFFARLAELRRPGGVSLLVCSRDPALAAAGADRLALLHAGRVVEQGPAGVVLSKPYHPYSQSLLACRPPWPPASVALPVLDGVAPGPDDGLRGCRFAPRCPLVAEPCRQGDPPDFAVGRAHDIACVRARAQP